MAQSSWPFESIDTSETQFSQWARNIGEGVETGYDAELAVSATGLAMTVTVGAGRAMVRGHFYLSNATETLNIASASAVSPRIDTVVLRLNPTANSIVLAVVTGTASATPVAPTLTQTDTGTYEYPLANVFVAANATAIGSGNVTDRRTYVGQIFWDDITGKPTVYNTSIIEQTVIGRSNNHTVQGSDANKTLYFTNTSNVTLTVPDVLDVGDFVTVVQGASGRITFSGSGITLGAFANRVQTEAIYAVATVTKVASGVYVVAGRLI